MNGRRKYGNVEGQRRGVLTPFGGFVVLKVSACRGRKNQQHSHILYDRRVRTSLHYLSYHDRLPINYFIFAQISSLACWKNVFAVLSMVSSRSSALLSLS